MPVVTIKRNPRVIPDVMLEKIVLTLSINTANALTCEEGVLTEEDIMVEVSDVGSYDRNCKDINILVFAHDYPSRRVKLDRAQLLISRALEVYLPQSASWYIWIILGTTSYGSDTQN